MESFFNTNIESNIETNNILYNIINSHEPKNIFLYGIIMIICIFISTKIIYNNNILIGIIFCSIIIYYIYTYKRYNTLTSIQIEKEKFDKLNTSNNILYKYPKIVDFLFYIENLKSNNYQEFSKLIELFENFCKLYEYCLINNQLISSNYKIFVDLKITILNTINNFIFTLDKTEYENIIIKQKISAENLIDELLNNLIILNKKKTYYDGYNVYSKQINTSNVLAYNIMYDSQYDGHYTQYNIGDLIFY